MRNKILNYLKTHPYILDCIYKIGRFVLSLAGRFIPLNNKILFSSYGGRGFTDSPKALYEEILNRKEFDGWDIVWAFVTPADYEIPKGRKIRIDTPKFFLTLLTSRIWISNSGMDRDIHVTRNGVIKVETWHGTPIKKIGGEENTNSMIVPQKHYNIDSETIRCAQSEYDRTIFSRVFHATKESFIMADLPRNDELVRNKRHNEILKIRNVLKIPEDKLVLLYMPTYREYMTDENQEIFMNSPITMAKWRAALGDRYVLLVRAHYAVSKALGLDEDGFIYDVSNYDNINDLYLISDALISDYSSAFFDFAILDRPMFCFAYDLEEYNQKRGLYLDLETELPCSVDKTEDEVLDHIINGDKKKNVDNVKAFHQKYAPFAGKASKLVVDEIIKRIN